MIRCCAILLLALATAAGAQDDESAKESADTAVTKSSWDQDALLKTHKSLLDASKDKLVAFRFVPSAEKPQGEIRLIKRGDIHLIQNILYTKFLKRAIGVIQKKEAKAWPDDRPGRADSDLYMDMLMQARDFLWEKFKNRENKEDRRQKILVELIHSKDADIIVFFETDIKDTEAGKPVQITKRKPFFIVPVSSQYLMREMHLICRDALELSMEDAQKYFPIENPEKEVIPEKEEEED